MRLDPQWGSSLCKVCESRWDEDSMDSIGLGMPGRPHQIPEGFLKPALLLQDLLVSKPPASHWLLCLMGTVSPMTPVCYLGLGVEWLPHGAQGAKRL